MTETELVRLKSLWPDLFPGNHTPAELGRFAEHLCTRHKLAQVAIHRVKAGAIDGQPLIAFRAAELGSRTLAHIERAAELSADQAGAPGGSPWMLRCEEPGETRTHSLLASGSDSKGNAWLFIFTAVGEMARHKAAELLVTSQSIVANCFGTGQRDTQATAAETHSKLSQRELECLLWTAEGKTSEDIAIILQLSVHTINHYLTAATRKLNAVNRLHAVARAMRCGLLSGPAGETGDGTNSRVAAGAV